MSHLSLCDMQNVGLTDINSHSTHSYRDVHKLRIHTVSQKNDNDIAHYNLMHINRFW